MTKPDLGSLGFSTKETAVYLLLLKYKKLTIPQISRHAGLKRTTVYHLVDELLARGVIAEDKATKQRTVLAYPPEGLLYEINLEKKALAKKETVTRAIVEQLNEIDQETLYPTPRIRFVPETEIVDFLKEHTPIWNASIKERDGVWWGFQDPSYVENFQEVIDYYWKHPSSKGVKLQVLSSESAAENERIRKLYPDRLIRFWNKSEAFSSTIWAVGDYVLMLRTQQHPYFVVEHHEPELAKNLRQLFKWIWETVPTI